MLNTLEDITQQLVIRYDPESIILFGSYNTMKFKNDSDIDLFIIKKTEKRVIERQIEVETILADRSVPLDLLVYTPEEVRSLYSLGSPFIEEIMDNGRLIYMRKATEAWINEAAEELDSAIILFDHEKYRGACYHSQQCVEKGLKAIILEKGKKPGRIHDIVELNNEVKELGYNTGITVEESIFLNSIYKGRYPTESGLLPHGEPLSRDAEKAIKSAESFMERLKKLT